MIRRSFLLHSPCRGGARAEFRRRGGERHRRSTDSGSVGTFTLTNVGVSGNTSTLSLAFVPPSGTSEFLNQVTDTAGMSHVGLNIPALFDSPITLMLTSLGGGDYR